MNHYGNSRKQTLTALGILIVSISLAILSIYLTIKTQ
jgi:hypothetical protein